MYRGLLFSILLWCTLPGAVQADSANECAQLRHWYPLGVYGTTSAALKQSVKEIATLTEITAPPVCEVVLIHNAISGQVRSYTVDGVSRTWFLVNDDVPREFSPEELRGLAAHEFAHLYIRKHHLLPPLVTPIQIEMIADKLAATWVGRAVRQERSKD